MKRVKCTISFNYDPATYIYEWENIPPSEDEMLQRCREMMLEDLTSIDAPFDPAYIMAEFIENSDAQL